MRRFLIAGYVVLACAGLFIASAPTESQAQGIAAPPVVVTAPTPQCSLGFALEGQKCVFKHCPPNHKLVDRKCEKIVIHIPKHCSLAEQLANKCGKDGQLKATDLTPKKCPSGESLDGKKGCVKDSSASDLVPACPVGQHWAGKKGCVKN